MFLCGSGLAPAERDELGALGARITGWLRPVIPEEIAAELVIPLDVVRVRRDEPAAETLAAAQYAEALAGRPVGAVIEARIAINRDEVDWLDRRFMPTPTELARLVREIGSAGEAARIRIAALLSAAEDPPPPTAEERERRAAAAERALRRAVPHDTEPEHGSA